MSQHPNPFLLSGLVLSAVLAASQPALAAPGEGRFFRQADSNGDGVIDASEATAMREKAFERLDSDGDGLIARSEMENRRHRRQQMADGLFARADSNGDDALSRDEFLAQPGLLEKADSDGDGAVSQAEAQAAGERLRSRMESRQP